MDAFYASVEQRDNPDYRGKPVIVGALPGHRGVVSTCSYEARQFGVRSGLPISYAYSRCPQGIYILPRMKHYQQVSNQIMTIFQDYSPAITQLSVDEAFLDMTGTQKLFGDPQSIAETIKKRVYDELGLTLSIGIAPNYLVAKMASDYNKPNGLYEVTEDKIEDFIDLLPLKDLWGVGKKSLQIIAEVGITSTKQLRQVSLEELKSLFGQASAHYLYNVVRGIDPGLFGSAPKSHSISAERTYPEDTRDVLRIERTLLEISHTIMFRLMQESFRGKTLVFKIRYEDFTTSTIQQKRQTYLTSAEEIYEGGLELLRKKWNRTTPIRLIGLGVTNLEKLGGASQQELFETPYTKKRKLEETVLRIKNKFPEGKITKASLLKTEKDIPSHPLKK